MLMVMSISLNSLTRLKIVFSIGLIALSLYILMSGFQKGAASLSKNVPGFTLSGETSGAGDGLVVTSLVHPQWTGNLAGIKLGDRVLTFDGHALNNSQDLFAYLNQIPPPKMVHYQVIRSGGIVAVDVPPMLFTWEHFLLTYFSNLLVGFVLIGVSSIFFFIRPQRTKSFVFFLSCASIGLPNLLILDYYTTQQNDFLVFYGNPLLRVVPAASFCHCV